MSAPQENTIKSMFWEEQPEKNNPFRYEKCFCHGYDVYGDILENLTWIEYLYLTFCGEVPEKKHAMLLEKLAMILLNPGPRDLSVRAAMNAGVSGTPASTMLLNAVSVGGGQFGGAREVVLAMALLKKVLRTSSDEDIALILKKTIEPVGPSIETDLWPDLNHIPGFDPHSVSGQNFVSDLLNTLTKSNEYEVLNLLKEKKQMLEETVGYPLSMVGVVAAIFDELQMKQEHAELLYAILRLPGAAMHGYEQNLLTFKEYPFFAEGLILEDDPLDKHTKE